MSITTEITRIQNAVPAIKTSITNKGVTVPASTKIDGLSEYSDQISTGGDSGTFEYSNWIAYGLTEPDPTKYKYWFPIDTTPQQTPLKYVYNYYLGDYISGKLKEDFDNGTATSTQSRAGLYDWRYNSSDGCYYWCSNGFGKLNTYYTSTKLYKTNSSSTTVMSDWGNTSKCTLVATLSDIFGKASYSSYCMGAFDVNDGYLYGAFDNYIYKYSLSTGTKSTFGSTSFTLVSTTSSDYCLVGLFYINSTTLLAFHGNVSSKQISAIKLGNTTNQSKNTLKTVSIGTQVSNFQAIKLDSNRYLLLYKSQSTILSSYEMFIYNYSTNTFTTLTYPVASTNCILIFSWPLNEPLFYFSTLGKVYRLSGTSFVEFPIGNILRSCLYSHYAINYLDATTFKATIPKDKFSLIESASAPTTVRTVSFDSLNSPASIIEEPISQDIAYSIYSDETHDSSANVILASNIAGSSFSQAYKFFPEHTKNYFMLCSYQAYTTNCVYNQAYVQIKHSINGVWSTASDPTAIIGGN